MSVRDVVKRAVETAAALGGTRAAERANRRAFAVLSYHNIVPDGERVAGDASLHLPVAAFRAQLDELATHYPIVGLDRLSDGLGETAPRVAITFDDAYTGAVVAGVAEIARRGLPATIFVPAGMLGRRTFWWDRLADDAGRIGRERREHALWRLQGADDAVSRWMEREGIEPRALPEHATSATAEELAAAARAPGITIAAHGWSHLNLASLDPAALVSELDRPAESLAHDFPSYRPWLAYPYGSASATVETAAAGRYELAFRIEGGLLRPGDRAERPRSLPRINVPAGLSPRGLRLRASGLLR